MSAPIQCPHCGQSFSIDEALSHDLKEKLKQKYQTEMEEKTAKLAKSLENKYRNDLKLAHSQLENQENKLKKLQHDELELLKEKRRLEQERREMELKVAKTIDEESQKIRQSTEKSLLEQFHLKELEKDKVIQDLKRSLEDAQRKATQSSQQLQGEVQELDLESTLRQLFPHDVIEPVGKGVSGADIKQTVKSPSGQTVCGIILWESKRTKAWSDGWLNKLKADMRQEKAHVCVIVSSVLPLEAESGLGLKDGVWVTSPTLYLPLAQILRKSLLDIAYQKTASVHQSKKADLVYDYITGHEFRQQVEALVEVYQEMSLQLMKERASFERVWKSREGQLQRMLLNTARVYGSLQGLVGSAMPQLKGLDIDEPVALPEPDQALNL